MKLLTPNLKSPEARKCQFPLKNHEMTRIRSLFSPLRRTSTLKSEKKKNEICNGEKAKLSDHRKRHHFQQIQNLQYQETPFSAQKTTKQHALNQWLQITRNRYKRNPKSNKQILSDQTEISFPDRNPQKDMQSESLETVKQLEIAEMEDSTPHLKSTASIGKISSFSRNLLRFKACMQRFGILFLPFLALVPAKWCALFVPRCKSARASAKVRRAHVKSSRFVLVVFRILWA